MNTTLKENKQWLSFVYVICLQRYGLNQKIHIQCVIWTYNFSQNNSSLIIKCTLLHMVASHKYCWVLPCKKEARAAANISKHFCINTKWRVYSTTQDFNSTQRPSAGQPCWDKIRKIKYDNPQTRSIFSPSILLNLARRNGKGIWKYSQAGGPNSLCNTRNKK